MKKLCKEVPLKIIIRRKDFIHNKSLEYCYKRYKVQRITLKGQTIVQWFVIFMKNIKIVNAWPLIHALRKGSLSFMDKVDSVITFIGVRTNLFNDLRSCKTG